MPVFPLAFTVKPLIFSTHYLRKAASNVISGRMTLCRLSPCCFPMESGGVEHRGSTTLGNGHGALAQNLHLAAALKVLSIDPI